MTVFRRTAGMLASPVEQRFSDVLAEHMRLAAGVAVSAADAAVPGRPDRL